MKRLMRHRPSPAMVIACIALGIALTGIVVDLAATWMLAGAERPRMSPMRQ